MVEVAGYIALWILGMIAIANVGALFVGYLTRHTEMAGLGWIVVWVVAVLAIGSVIGIFLLGTLF